eukprot:6183338-Pleurochrysis_carterae.AAC.1
MCTFVGKQRLLKLMIACVVRSKVCTGGTQRGTADQARRHARACSLVCFMLLSKMLRLIRLQGFQDIN